MSPDNRLLRAALAYPGRFGFMVFPCLAQGKTPRTQHGFKDAVKNVDPVRRLWRSSPNANVGIATGSTSGIVVLDVDPQHAGDQTFGARSFYKANQRRRNDSEGA